MTKHIKHMKGVRAAQTAIFPQGTNVLLHPHPHPHTHAHMVASLIHSQGATENDFSDVQTAWLKGAENACKN